LTIIAAPGCTVRPIETPSMISLGTLAC
jgi:hypothetical protein